MAMQDVSLLEDIARRSLETGLDPDDLFLEKEQPAKLPEGVLPAGGVAALESVLREAYRIRLPRQLETAADYGLRVPRPYPLEEGDEVLWQARGMTDADMNVLLQDAKLGRGGPPPVPEGRTEIQLGFGQSLVLATTEVADMKLSSKTMLWLFKWQNASLAWTLFGVGAPFRIQVPDSVRPVPWSAQKDGSFRDGGKASWKELSDLRPASWSTVDWMIFSPKQRPSTSPGRPMGMRLARDLELPSPSVVNRDLPQAVDWFWRWVAGEFANEVPSWPDEGPDAWKKKVLIWVLQSRRKTALLAGITPSTFNILMNKSDADTASRPGFMAMWSLCCAVRMGGRKAFLYALDVLNDEAKARGFKDLSGVFERKTWSLTGRQEKQEEEEMAESVSSRKSAGGRKAVRVHAPVPRPAAGRPRAVHRAPRKKTEKTE